MELKSLHLHNFRCYSDLEITFDKKITVLVGLNGRGKSAILDGIELALSALDGEPLGISSRDVRMEPLRENKKIVGMEQRLPVEIEADLGKLKLYRRLEERHGETFDTVTGKNMETGPVHIFVYYDIGRIEEEAHFFSKSYAEIKDAFPVIKNAVNRGLHRYNIKFDYNKKLDKFVFIDNVDGELLAEGASDGARCAMGMVADLAWQIAMTNPDLGAKAAEVTPGIVLIDEVDLLLHPSWQQTVLTDLMRTFPKIQFVVTTHSPQVLSTVKAKQIRILDDKNNMVVIPNFALGAESKQLLEDIQHVSTRPTHIPIVRSLNRYLKLVAEDKFDTPEALVLRKTLDNWCGGNDPVLLRADMDIRLRKMRRQK